MEYLYKHNTVELVLIASVSQLLSFIQYANIKTAKCVTSVYAHAQTLRERNN